MPRPRPDTRSRAFEANVESDWLLFVPTQAAEGGFYARVRLSHLSQEVFATCSDAKGLWLKHFYDIESYIEWLDTIACGAILSLPSELPLPRQEHFESLAS